MRKKIAIVLVLCMMISCVNVWADINDADNNVMKSTETAKIITESVESSETKNPTATVSSASLKKETDEMYSIKNKETSLSEGDIIYNVSFPANIRVQLDPGNLIGKGQVFSEYYQVENYGNTDVTIKIKNIEVVSSVENYDFSETETLEEPFQTKKIHVDMIWENKDGTNKRVLPVENGTPNEYVIKLEAAQHDKESMGYFYFTGTMNASPYINWDSANIRVTFHYEILSPMDMEEESFEEKLENDLGKNNQIEGIPKKDSATDKQDNIIGDKEYTDTKATGSNAQEENPEIKEIKKAETGEDGIRSKE